MYLVITASKDTYVTDKIIDNKFRVKDANVGRAGSIDIFKLYAESRSGSDETPTELSRGLIKFDLSRIQDLTASICDFTDSSFKCQLKLFDVMGSQLSPENYTLVVAPLSKSFDEGIGRDVGSFDDLDVANFVTASYSNGSANVWNLEGANKSGSITYSSGFTYPTNTDILTEGNLNDGDGSKSLTAEQTFVNGDEDLLVDVTTIVSATLAGILPDLGFRLSFTGSEETDAKTRFVKRFASRHVSNPNITPRLLVSFDDSIIDNHSNFLFDVSGSLFLKNSPRGVNSNIVSGSALTSIVGTNCMQLQLVSGTYSDYFNVSQHTGSTTGAGITGLYSSSFALPFVTGGVVFSASGYVLEETINDYAIKSGSITFETYWKSNDKTLAFHTGSLTISRIPMSTYVGSQKDLIANVTNGQKEYLKTDKVVFNIFTQFRDYSPKATKLPYAAVPDILEEAYYRILDANSGDIIVPYEKSNNGTRLSADSNGMYFEFHMENLSEGRAYKLEMLAVDRGVEYTVDDLDYTFKVV